MTMILRVLGIQLISIVDARHKHIKDPKNLLSQITIFMRLVFWYIWRSHIGLFLFVLRIFDYFYLNK
jgi:hypothetical protein